ncbi:MAG: imidazolonepropionase, partial [Paracoccaceae bacterium]|nr:imidazolonepropionase [Paracoccaceae bacterium]
MKTLTNAQIVTLKDNDSFGLISHGAIVIEEDKIAWVGQASDLAERYNGNEEYDLKGRLVTPALIDCHSHIVFGGNRAAEFEQRLNGVSYEDISKAGGGIVSTVTATRSATHKALLADALTRVDAMMAEGVSTIEVKSGYG